jgi:hypothetical protein
LIIKKILFKNKKERISSEKEDPNPSFNLDIAIEIKYFTLSLTHRRVYAKDYPFMIKAYLRRTLWDGLVNWRLDPWVCFWVDRWELLPVLRWGII